MENKNDTNLIGNDVEKITIFDTKNNKELAIITNTEVHTANSDVVVKIKFKD